MIPSLLLPLALLLQTPDQENQGPRTYEDASGRPRVRIQETLIGFNDPAMNEESFVASPDGRRVAYMVMAGDGLAVVVDGVQGELFEGIADQSIVFSSNGQHLGYVGTRPGQQCVVLDGKVHPYRAVSRQGVVFSSDGTRWGWSAVRDGKHLAVVDGVESPPYDSIAPPGVLFSPDGRRCAYAAATGGQQLVVTDGEDGPLFDSVGGLQFTAKGRVVYLASRAGKRHVVVDGQTLGPFDELRTLGTGAGRNAPMLDVLEISSDGSRVGFVAQRGEEWFVVVDGQELGPYENVAGLSLSPEGSRVAFLASRGEGWMMVIDGKEQPGEGMQSLSFSPDGKRLASILRREGRTFAQVDGQEGPAYDSIAEPGVRFSHDGQHWTYLAETGGEQRVVLDGQEGPTFRRLGKTPLAFVPNGPGVMYSIRRGEREALVINGQEGPAVKSYRTLTFSPDGLRYAYAAELDTDRWIVVVDGERYGPGGKLGPDETQAYASLGKRTPLFSPDGKRAAWVGVRDTGWVAAVDGVESRPFNLVMRSALDFSPDGQHVVFVAAREGRKMIVVDDFEIAGGWDGFLHKSDLVWEGPRRFSIRGARSPKYVLIEVEIL
ncbi:MAG TPA: hypothetical protein VF530_16955 [Planctomycetota bacterium]